MSLTDPSVFYLSVADYREQTLAPTPISKLADSAVKSLLLETMARIDAYVGGGWEPFADGQEFIFPRSADEDDDGNAVIPRPVQLATRMIADAVVKKRQSGVLAHEVASESNLGHSYQRKTGSRAGEYGFEDFPPEAAKLLEQYRLPATLATSDPGL